MNDEQIVELYRLRDESAISETRDKYHAYLMKIARNILESREDSEESVNDTYLAAWNSIPPHLPTVLATYLGKLTRRISISLFRRLNAQKRQGGIVAVYEDFADFASADAISSEGNPEAELEAKRLSELLSTFLRSLKADERRTFIGRYYYMDGLKSVADYCGMSEAKAKTMLFRTRKKLKEYLAKEGYDL